MTSPLSALSALLITLGASVALGLTATPAAAQTAPPVYTAAVYLSYRAPATVTGESVLFSGTGTITTRVSRDAATGVSSLVATFDTKGIVGTGYPSLTRYVLNSREQMILPHALSQTVELSFPMEPTPGSPIKTLRSGTVNMTFFTDMNTGAVVQIRSSSVSLL